MYFRGGYGALVRWESEGRVSIYPLELCCFKDLIEMEWCAAGAIVGARLGVSPEVRWKRLRQYVLPNVSDEALSTWSSVCAPGTGSWGLGVRVE